MKRKTADFLCAFLISVFVFMCMFLVVNADFFEGAVKWHKDSAVLDIFGAEFAFDRAFPGKIYEVLVVNDVFVCDGFADFVVFLAKALLDYSADVMKLLYELARNVTGSAAV